MTNSPSPPSLFDTDYKALVIGASGAIGGAFVAAFQADPRCSLVTQLSRSQTSGFDVLDESSVQQQAEVCRASGPYHIIIDATGALTIDGVGPEKSLASLREDTLMKNFHINAVAPALVLRHFAPLLASGPSLYAKLSARVGSISDNTKGGWYGYRAAKAALNMVLQTAAIEAARKRPQLVVAAMQPGTVASNLSAPFVPANECLTPAQSVAGLLSALDGLPALAAAHFVDHKGATITW